MKKVLFFSVVAIFLNFHVWFKGNIILQQGAFYGFLCFYIITSYRKMHLRTYKKPFKGYISLAILCWIFVLFSSLVWPVLYGTYDFSFVRKILSILLRCIEQVALILMIYQNIHCDRVIDTYIIVSANSGILYVLGTIVMIAFPELKMWWRSIIRQTEAQDSMSNMSLYVTRFGFSGFSGFSHTVLCSFFLTFMLFLMYKKNVLHQKIPGKYYLIILILFIGNLFYGRTGVVLSAFAISLILALLIIRYRKVKTLISITLVLLLVIGIIFLTHETIPIMGTIYRWSIESSFNFIFKGYDTSGSVGVLQSMHFVPEMKTFLFGDGYYSTSEGGGYYMQTDVGYLREILFYGVFNLTLAYGCFALGLIAMSKGLNLNNHSVGTYMGMIIFVLVAICEYKGETYQMIIGYVIALWAASCIDYNICKIK